MLAWQQHSRDPCLQPCHVRFPAARLQLSIRETGFGNLHRSENPRFDYNVICVTPPPRCWQIDLDISLGDIKRFGFLEERLSNTCHVSQMGTIWLEITGIEIRMIGTRKTLLTTTSYKSSRSSVD